MSRAQTTEAAGDVLLPRRPRAGGDGEAADLVARLAREDGDGAAQLLRQRLADQADASMTQLEGGEAQGGGAHFAKDIAGTDQQERDLRAVMAALQRPTAP
ncbi:hypothetical protein ASG52_12825 [Methylobacterium sp. Leaf456]|uniref:hypothetical protein n=1 Tax=Methylobacterium sp. Leaf456 TaxID=1736382 RepID=UPI0006FFFC4A|nr:hypothetical protein [Methylobacterium sp. Leaf456]KQT46597.1 hypothetical protein ASG52_12825 [Methylobacterium sp. Leaf456]